MRKFAITVTAATMLLGGLAGCGVDNQAQDMGARQGQGYGTQGQLGNQGTIGIQGTHGTTPGVDGTHGTQGTRNQGGQGLFGGQGTGSQGGGLFGGQRTGNQGGGLFGGQGTGNQGGLFGGHGTGTRGGQGMLGDTTRGTGQMGQTDGAWRGQGTVHGLNGVGTGQRQADQGVTRGTEARWTGEGPITDMFTRDDRARTRGTATGNRGTTATQNGQRGNRVQSQHSVGLTQRGNAVRVQDMGELNLGRRISTYAPTQNNRTGEPFGVGAGEISPDGTRQSMHEGRGTTGTRMGAAGRRSGDHSGIVGDRPGMVDDRGVLRDEVRPRQGITGQANQTRETGDRARTQTADRTQRGQGTAANYHRSYDGASVQKIQDRLAENDIRDSRVIVHDDTVVVAVDSDDRDVQKRVRNTVGDTSDAKNIHVVSDRDAVSRVRTMDDRLRGGAAWEEVGATFTEMINDLGRAAQRPFERTR
ncbi:YhcN/YlaJ family sporulation lipoprotein [Bacillus alkalicellulosilyticus]|uniref:YhcN/YlaJ family sporulation lipoprotein n=1 Tax=Alkalihalobacterium alkalicellulosilyticum TaxID=1912214 RepID=UPI0009964FA4|nr:YhcN/YlaJ family sporulation lipoprotein [Bacillus alkalicellulosilyticus]